ncbi:MAG: endonuclease MutS2 [Bacteroidota bacterium]
MNRFSSALTKLEFETVLRRVIRYAQSDPGRDLLAALSVSTSLDEIRTRLGEVTEMKRLLEEEEGLPLEGIFDVRDSLSKARIEGTLLLPRELLEIGRNLRAARILRGFAAKRREKFPFFWKIADRLHTDKVLEFNIDQAIDESGAVRNNASKDLASVRRSMAERYEQLKKRLEGILKSVTELGFCQDEIITTREGRMVIPVKAEHKNHVPGFVHSASASGATVFVEPADTLELNNEIRSLQFQEQREIQRILRLLTGQVAESGNTLLQGLDLLAEIDALQARGRYSIEILGVEPDVTTEGPLRLVQARHPILLLNHGFQGTIPLDLKLGDGYNTLVISGPNAGGKSVALKCVGILVLMTQAGLHIPVGEETQIRIFEGVFVDIGDEQSIESDLSTFSSHLSHLKEIARDAGKESLVLIDEIGAGTDPAEGGALAATLLEHLTTQGALTVATTHQGALKVFAHEASSVENGAMEFDQSTLTPTYRFKAGVPGSSYALEMAGRIGFDQSLMARARELMGKRETQLEMLLTQLEATAQRYRSDMEDLQLEKAQLDVMVRDYEDRKASLSSELRTLKRQALDEAQRIVDEANGVIERSVKEIRESAADRETVKSLRRDVETLKERIVSDREAVKIESAIAENDNPLSVGSTVRLRNGTDSGEVLDLSADGRFAEVVFGTIRMRVPASDLRVTKRPPTPARHGSLFAAPDRMASVQRDLDLRGMTGDEALPLIDKFIDDASLAGLHRIDIIHGKGTGALRKKVTSFLEKHPRVKTFRIADWNEGGTGATVVELEDVQ